MERLEKELKQLEFAKLEKFEDNHYIIRKEVGIRLEEDNCYVVKLKDSMYNQDTLLVSNWNRGIVPKAKYYQIDVQKKMGNMIKVAGLGYSDEYCNKVIDNFSGWFPISEIEVIKKL